jgi:hypothetical protein
MTIQVCSFGLIFELNCLQAYDTQLIILLRDFAEALPGERKLEFLSERAYDHFEKELRGKGEILRVLLVEEEGNYELSYVGQMLRNATLRLHEPKLKNLKVVYKQVDNIFLMVSSRDHSAKFGLSAKALEIVENVRGYQTSDNGRLSRSCRCWP